MRTAVAVVVLLALASLSACAAHQPGPIPFAHPPGFWYGIWHGLIAPFSFIGSLFTNVRIYAFPNGGVWYDLGFLLGIGAWGGGAAAAR